MMQKQEIVALSQYQNSICVSLIARTHRSAPENSKDQVVVKNLLNQARERLLEVGSSREVEPILERISTLIDEVDWNHTEEGLLLFASDDFSLATQVPYPVRSRVVIDETFATRDLLFTLNRSPHYRVLVLSEKPTRLYEAFRDQVFEVKSGGFPLEHAGPGGSASLPNPTYRNLSRYRDDKHREFFRQVDRRLASIQAAQPLPLVVMGVDRYLAFFRETSQHMKWVVGTVEGSYDWKSEAQISSLAWPVMERHLDSMCLQRLGELEAAVSANRYASTVDKVWRAAREGRVATLLVEEDYHFSAGVDENGYLVEEGAVMTMEDAVDELAELVIQRGGDVVFLPNSTLEAHQRIAAILRF